MVKFFWGNFQLIERVAFDPVKIEPNWSERKGRNLGLNRIGSGLIYNNNGCYLSFNANRFHPNEKSFTSCTQKILHTIQTISTFLFALFFVQHAVHFHSPTNSTMIYFHSTHSMSTCSLALAFALVHSLTLALALYINIYIFVLFCLIFLVGTHVQFTNLH